MLLRTMESCDRWDVAELICVSTNTLYEQRGGARIFPAGPEATRVFFDVYQALDPGCGLVAENPVSGRLMGSCFYHERDRHLALGIMNVHPCDFGRGVGRALLQHVLDYADQKGLPAVRLTSSALNLDSFSLYNRAGFVPQAVYQDMLIQVPEGGLACDLPGARQVRPATIEDVPALADLEETVAGIRRERDYRYTIEQGEPMWETLVFEGPHGRIDGFLISVKHAAVCLLGPGVMRTEAQATALIGRALDRYRGGMVVFLVPVLARRLVETMYAWGARNCELHFCQVRGEFQPFRGVNMPTFLPETG